MFTLTMFDRPENEVLHNNYTCSDELIVDVPLETCRRYRSKLFGFYLGVNTYVM